MSGTTHRKRTAPLVWTLIIIVVLLIFVPLFVMRGSSFSGSDDAGSQEVSVVTGSDYEPWFTPVLTRLLGVDELPGEVESLFFCIQTGIGVGIIAFAFGYLVARKKYGGDRMSDDDAADGSDGASGDDAADGSDGASGDDAAGKALDGEASDEATAITVDAPSRSETGTGADAEPKA